MIDLPSLELGYAKPGMPPLGDRVVFLKQPGEKLKFQTKIFEKAKKLVPKIFHMGGNKNSGRKNVPESLGKWGN